jgi:hypothetical protein
MGLVKDDTGEAALGQERVEEDPKVRVLLPRLRDDHQYRDGAPVIRGQPIGHIEAARPESTNQAGAKVAIGHDHHHGLTLGHSRGHLDKHGLTGAGG